jgi:DNA-binding transcriptional MerR regulator
MEYRIEQLAERTSLRVDTIRFYQGRGLIPMPERRGRVAVYCGEHLDAILRVRGLLDEGFTLAQIRKLLDREAGGRRAAEAGDAASTDLLRALVDESVGRRTLTRAELAQESGVPEAMITSIQRAGLMEPVTVEGEERFTEADVDMARAALAILGQGFPIAELLQLAVGHAQHVQTLADEGISLFDDHVRKQPGASPAAITDAFRDLLPHVTRLVALHFQRTLVNRALERLRASGESEALEQALEATASARLEVSWR